MRKFRDIKVVIRSSDGHYLAGGPTEYALTNHFAEAAVFDYLGHKVEAQLERLRQSHGLVLEAVHVASPELHETCDRCEKNVLPTIAFFNGTHFLCPGCNDDALAA